MPPAPWIPHLFNTVQTCDSGNHITHSACLRDCSGSFFDQLLPLVLVVFILMHWQEVYWGLFHVQYISYQQCSTDLRMSGNKVKGLGGGET